ncbi:MAG: multicopper oxidase domain-containing protein, partial [Candidatus Binatia bacterium]
IYFVNLLEHQSGKRPEREIPLAEILSGEYAGDPAVGKFFEMRVVAYNGQDLSMNPADYVEGKKKMVPRPEFTAEELANARHRTFSFGRSNGTDSAPWTIKTNGGQGFGMDPHRLSAAPDEGTVEIWHLENGGGGWSHPVHIHFEEGQILQRGGKAPPIWERWARKDVYRIGRMPDSLDSVDVAIRFREFLGTYMEHCHNTQHEDHAMLLRYDVEHPGQMIAMPTPIPEWEGVYYDDSMELPTFKEGDVQAAADGRGIPRACGDVSGDGANNIIDALVIAQYTVRLRSCNEVAYYEMGDVDHDGACTIADALKLARCSVNLIPCDFTCAPLVCQAIP